LSCDRIDRPILHFARIGTLRAVAQNGSFTPGNAADFVITARNRCLYAAFDKIDLVFTKCGMLQEIKKRGEYLIEVLLQAVEAERGRIDASAGLDSCGNGLEFIVELIASFAVRASGAPGGGVNRSQSHLRCRLGT